MDCTALQAHHRLFELKVIVNHIAKRYQAAYNENTYQTNGSFGGAHLFGRRSTIA
jgi:hypothetical protein